MPLYINRQIACFVLRKLRVRILPEAHIAGRMGIQSCLISRTPCVRVTPPQPIYCIMEKNNNMMTCITGQTVRDIVRQANELGISRDNIVSLLPFNGQLCLVFYK